ncbi:MAG: hypothetical protein AAGD96_29010 [Chloroflexota bacterium]
MINKRRYANQEIWEGSNLPLFGSIGMFSLAVSCMFLTVGLTSSIPFLLYVPLIAAAMFLLGGYYEKHPVPRAVAWGMAWVIVAVTGLVVMVGSDAGILVCLGLLVLPTAGFVYALIQARAAYQAALAASTDQMLIDLVEMRSEITFAEADEELEIGQDDVLVRAESLLESKRLAGAIDVASKRLYSLGGLAAKQAKIAGVIQAQGEIGLEELSQELKVPSELLRQWIRQLARLGQLSGYVDWSREIVYSRQRDELQQRSSCPSCAAELKLAGQGIIGCEFCGAEIFI